MDFINYLPDSAYGWIAVFSAIIAGVIFVRRSDIKSLREANDDLRKRLDDKDNENKDLTKRLDSFRRELDELKGSLKEKDKIIKDLRLVQITNSPEMTAYMQDMKTFVTQSHRFMVDVTKVLQEIKGDLNK